MLLIYAKNAYSSIRDYRISYTVVGVTNMYQRLRDLREDRDLNQQALADLLHISQTTYSRYESGALDIPSVSLIRLAQFYNTSIDYLVGLTENPKPYR